MVKRLAALILLTALVCRPYGTVRAELTLPGSIPTLAPLSAPLNNITFPEAGVSPTPTSVPAAQAKPKTGTGFSVSRIISPYLGSAYKSLSRWIGGMKLDGVTKAVLLQFLKNALEFIKSYNERIDPIIRSLLTRAVATLPGSIRGFTSILIPLLTIAGKVVLGIIAAIISLKIILYVLGAVLSSLFNRKRRRR